MTDAVIIAQLMEHEGLKLKPYHCSADKLTIGVGRNLEDKGITEKEALYLLKNDISDCIADLQKVFGGEFWILPEIVQRVLVDMRFNLGATGFRGFKKMIAAVKEDDFGKAALEMRDSKWFKQVGN
ncbi:lysozyme, partial [Candidatus Pacearchaeota archaeon]|nr:lysozyme [Candidatus Pacearchaeota archaeon]